MSVPTINTSATDVPLFSAVLKRSPEDFVVEEQFDIELDGQGEHLFLHVEKTGLNTADLQEVLQKAYAVSSADVGLCGLKDRHAVTRQWFSVRTPDSAQRCQAALDELSNDGQSALIIDSARHGRKLRRGAHRGNTFTVVLRDVVANGNGISNGNGNGNGNATGTGTMPATASAIDKAAVRAAIDQRITRVGQRGFPNYIGPQRFGFGGQNLVRARQWFRQPRKRTSRQQRSLWLSAARSALFNEVCAERVRENSWEFLLPGEPAMLSGNRSFFDSTTVSANELAERLANFDIHPSAPWWGKGEPVAKGSCAAFESTVLQSFGDLCSGLEKAGLPQERRSIRALAQGLTHQWLDPETLKLTFSLEPGVFATTLLAELGSCKEEPTRS